jgi:hypothetical protein
MELYSTKKYVITYISVSKKKSWKKVEDSDSLPFVMTTRCKVIGAVWIIAYILHSSTLHHKRIRKFLSVFIILLANTNIGSDK